MAKKTEKGQQNENNEISKGKRVQISEQRRWERKVLNYQPTKDELVNPPSGPSGVPIESKENEKNETNKN